MSLAHEHCVDLPVSNVLTLAATAVAHDRYPWLDFRDRAAERVWQDLGADASSIADTELRAALGRTLLMDKVVRRWARSRPGSPLVEIGAGLSTRHARIPDLATSMVAVDESPIAAVRKEIFPQPRPFQQVGTALEGREWVRRIAGAGSTPPLVLVEDAFLDLRPCDVVSILTSLSAELPRGSMIAASYGARTPMGIAHPEAQRWTLEVRCGCGHAVRFPRLGWAAPPDPLGGAALAGVALLEIT